MASKSQPEDTPNRNRDKYQFLDPIGASCRIILLKFSEPKTKIRITDNTIQLVADTYTEKLLYRPWVFKDSREDIVALCPMIVRFIELYLLEKTSEKPTDVMDDQFNFLSMDVLTKKTDDTLDDECRDYLIKLANYIIKGLRELEMTYGICTATFTLQFYCNLLTAAMNKTYSHELLPEPIKKVVSQNLFNDDKIKHMWTNKSIIELGELFEKFDEAHERNDIFMINAYGAAITAMLDARDKEFRAMIHMNDRN